MMESSISIEMTKLVLLVFGIIAEGAFMEQAILYGAIAVIIFVWGCRPGEKDGFVRHFSRRGFKRELYIMVGAKKSEMGCTL
jgi:hypothetical protein